MQAPKLAASGAGCSSNKATALRQSRPDFHEAMAALKATWDFKQQNLQKLREFLMELLERD